MKKSYAVCSILSGMCLSGGSLWAETVDTKLSDIVVSGRREQPALSSTQIDGEEIRRRRGVSVADFLNGEAGVMSSNKRNGGSLSVNIRGVQDENRVPVSVDGVLQSIPSWQGYSGSSTRSFLDPDLLESVDIDKGPSMAADAVGAVGGMVRAGTVDAEHIIKEGRDWGFRLRVGTMNNTVDEPALYTRGGYQTAWVEKCETNGSGLCREGSGQPVARYASAFPGFKAFHGSLAFAKRWQNADLVLAYAQRRQGNYFVGRHGPVPRPEQPELESGETLTVYSADKLADFLPAHVLNTCGFAYENTAAQLQRCYEDATIATVEKYRSLPPGATLYRAGEAALNTAHRSRSYLAKFNYRSGSHQAGIHYRRYESRFGEIMSSLLGFRGDGALQGEGSEITVDSVGANYRYRPANPWLDMQVSAYATRSDAANFTPLIGEYGHDLSERHAYFTLSKQAGINISNTSRLQLFDRPLWLQAGVSYSRERIEPPSDMAARVREKNYPDDAVGPNHVRDGLKQEWSAFVSGSYRFAPAWRLDAGLRYVGSRIRDFKPWADPATGLPTNHYQPSVNVSGTAPVVALSWEPSADTQLYLRHARAVRPPSLFQVAKGFSAFLFQKERLPLEAEYAQNWELGGRWQFDAGSGHRLKLRSAYFDNRINNYLTRVRVPARSGGRATIQTDNIDSVRFRGIETELQWDSPRWYGRLAWTHYFSSRFCLKERHVSGTEPRCLSGNIANSNIGNHVPPRNSVSTTLGGRWLNGRAEAGVRYTFHSRRLVPTIGNPSTGVINSLEWKSYGIFDVYGSYRVNDDLSLHLGIDNVGNRYYLDANNMGLNPAPGRTVHLKMDWRF